jgi:hypothetical protein
MRTCVIHQKRRPAVNVRPVALCHEPAFPKDRELRHTPRR